MGALRPPLPAFALAFALFHIAPAFLRAPVGAVPGLESGDLFDLLTPLVLVPLWGALFWRAAPGTPSPMAITIFLALAALWVLGQGMHLSANAISHLTRAAPESDVHRLVDFFDERLGHWAWHGATLGLTALLLAREAGATRGATPAPVAGPPRGIGPAGLGAALVYGLTFFIIVVEGQTGWMGVPFAAALAVYGLAHGRTALAGRPLLAFFTAGYTVAGLFFAGWALAHGGLPEFSAVGIID